MLKKILYVFLLFLFSFHILGMEKQESNSSTPVLPRDQQEAVNKKISDLLRSKDENADEVMIDFLKGLNSSEKYVVNYWFEIKNADYNKLKKEAEYIVESFEIFIKYLETQELNFDENRNNVGTFKCELPRPLMMCLNMEMIIDHLSDSIEGVKTLSNSKISLSTKNVDAIFAWEKDQGKLIPLLKARIAFREGDKVISILATSLIWDNLGLFAAEQQERFLRKGLEKAEFPTPAQYLTYISTSSQESKEALNRFNNTVFLSQCYSGRERYWKTLFELMDETAAERGEEDINKSIFRGLKNQVAALKDKVKNF